MAARLARSICMQAPKDRLPVEARVERLRTISGRGGPSQPHAARPAAESRRGGSADAEPPKGGFTCCLACSQALAATTVAGARAARRFHSKVQLRGLEEK